MDVIVSTGEQVTIALLAMALIKRGVPAVSYTGNQVRILTAGPGPASSASATSEQSGVVARTVSAPSSVPPLTSVPSGSR